LHPLFTKMDVYGHGRPTRIAYLDESSKIEQYVKPLPVSEGINNRVFGVPWFKHYRPEIIEEHADAYKKVLKNYRALLAEDTEKDDDASSKAKSQIGGYSSFFSSRKNTQ
ncbi:MAG: hypothetical protein ACETWQ_07780, partial [Phycisphaerae bacterium]